MSEFMAVPILGVPIGLSTFVYMRFWANDRTRTLFGVTCKLKRGERRYEVVRLGALGIKRYIKIRADANPYLPKFAGYYWRRRHRKKHVSLRPYRPGSSGPC